MSTPRIEAGRGTSSHGPSIKAPRMYEALRRKGYSKEKAARISNAAANGTLHHGRGPRAAAKGKFSLVSGGSTRMAGARGNKRGSGGRAVVTKAASVRGGHSRGRASKAAGRATRGRR